MKNNQIKKNQEKKMEQMGIKQTVKEMELSQVCLQEQNNIKKIKDLQNRTSLNQSTNQLFKHKYHKLNIRN